MLDFHSHVLFDVDHGVKDKQTYTKMVKEYVKQGFDTLVLTPHLCHPSAGCKSQNIEKNFAEAKKIAEQEGLKVILGCELYVDGTREQLDVLPIADEYVLMEFPPSSKPVKFEELLTKISNCGYRIVIAHVERYTWLNVKSKTFEFMRNMGCLFQVNMESVRHRKATPYLKANAVDIIASDNHGDFKAPKRLKKVLNKYPEIFARMQDLYLE